MSMVINLVEDHNIYLCEGGPVYNGGVQPTPITYLTQWKIVGNSEVHGVGNLTSWKVSGNSVVQDGAIMSCGDLGQDGKYHVKISNGVTIYDIPLDAPLRKVNGVADTIEFPSDTEGKALVTRNILSYLLENLTWIKHGTENRYYAVVNALNCVIPTNIFEVPLILCNKYTTVCFEDRLKNDKQITTLRTNSDYVSVTDSDLTSVSDIQGEILLQLATPTTELVDVSPFPVSPTDTYTSANVVPYSAFEHTENKEIWSCGEYNATDGKYHILVQPQGGSIADIALTEPLRKVNDVADTIEFPSDTDGKALVARNIKSVKWSDFDIFYQEENVRFATLTEVKDIFQPTGSSMRLTICLSGDFVQNNSALNKTGLDMCMVVYDNRKLYIKDYSINTPSAFQNKYGNHELLYRLANSTTELVDAPQIAEADSYTCVISQGGKAVSWSNFETG